MNISKGEVSEYQYSSTGSDAQQNMLSLGTANNSEKTIFRLTDLKVSAGVSRQAFKLYVASYDDGGKALELDIASNSVVDLHWEIPYKLHILASTVEKRHVCASTNATVKYSVCGYTEK